jgi:hypothetical protein
MAIQDTISEARNRGASDDLILQKIEAANPKVSQSISTARQRGANSTAILEQLISQNAATKLGEVKTPAVAKPTLGQKLTDVKERFIGRAEQAADVFAGQGALAKVRGVFQTAGAAAGAVGEAGFSLLGSAASFVTPDVIEDPIRKLGGEVVAKVADTDTVRRAIAWAQEHPESAADIESALDLIGLGTIAPAGKAAKAALPSVAKGAVKTATKLGEVEKAALAPNVGKLAKSIEENVVKVVRPEKADWNEVAYGNHSMASVARRIVQSGAPEVTPDLKMNWANNVSKLRKEIETKASAVDNELASVPPTVTASWTSIRNKAAKSIDEIFSNAEDKAKALQELKEQLAYEKQRYPRATLADLNKSKKGMWTVGYDSQRPLRNRVARLIGHEMKNQIEEKAAKYMIDLERVKTLNKEIGELSTAIGLMENATGRIVEGGRLGQYFASAIGASLGGAAGSVVPGAGTLIGGAAGAAIAAKGQEALRRTLPKRLIGKAAKAEQALSKAEGSTALKAKTLKAATQTVTAPAKTKAKPKAKSKAGKNP